MLNTAVKWQLLDSNPTRDGKLFKLDDPQVERVLSYGEEDKLLAACEDAELKYLAPHLKPIIMVAVYTGLRRGEILRLRWADIDFDNPMLTVRKSKTRAGKGRQISLNSMLRDVLLTLQKEASGEWVFPSPKIPHEHIGHVQNSFRRAVKISGIPHITFHQLRHTFCTRLGDAGVPFPVIQELAGHASILMTRRYLHPANELKIKDVELLLRKEKVSAPTTIPTTPAPTQTVREARPRHQPIVRHRVRRSSRKVVATASTT